MQRRARLDCMCLESHPVFDVAASASEPMFVGSLALAATLEDIGALSARLLRRNAPSFRARNLRRHRLAVNSPQSSTFGLKTMSSTSVRDLDFRALRQRAFHHLQPWGSSGAPGSLMGSGRCMLLPLVAASASRCSNSIFASNSAVSSSQRCAAGQIAATGSSRVRHVCTAFESCGPWLDRRYRRRRFRIDARFLRGVPQHPAVIIRPWLGLRLKHATWGFCPP